MKTKFLAGGGACLLLAGTAHAQAVDTQLWGTVSVSAAISGRLGAGIDLSLRTGDNNPQLSTTFIRPSVSYKVSKAVSLRAGYVRVYVRPAGGAGTFENRLYEEVNWTLGKALGGVWSSRTQLEERMVEKRRDTGWRVRERAKFVLPLAKDGPGLVITSEWIFALNSTDYGAHAGFDQTRNFIGLNVPLDKHASLEAGYMHRYAFRHGTPDRRDNIFPVTLAYRF